ncbi:MAG TPA: GWxTD domain-containing protein [Terriglobales bacterium]|nr:GWxTD domain-containing protein [Terriglobales bacterium]
MSKHFKQLKLLCCLCLIACLAPISIAAAPNQSKKTALPKHYSDWLNRDVAYIITRQERQDFLNLASDDARDKFIEHFWAIRNPVPGSNVNTYKDDVYQRIAYANAHFGIGSGGEGWRSDRGRTYITLGAPKQIQRYYGAPNMRPFEIWFYSNASPALPPFFYIVFYQRDNIGDYRYYSPYMDGPDKLVTGTEATNDPQAALHMIQSAVGPEVAHIAQSLIPGEPLDPNGRISLESDMLLADVKNFANQPANVAELDRRNTLIESVTSRLIVDSNKLDIVLLPVRDDRGLTRLDYAIRLRDPSDLTMTKNEDGRYSYTVEVRVQVFSADGKTPIFTQEKTVSGTLDKNHFDEIHDRPLGYEGLLPLTPGKYHLDFLFTDWAKKTGFHAVRDVTVPAVTAETFAVPAILPFSAVNPGDRSKDDTTPFEMAGLRFTPMEMSPVLLNPDEPLNVAYQLWAAPQDPSKVGGQKIDVQYGLGQPAIAGTATVLSETVDMGQFSPSGSLVDGKKIPLVDKPAGSYLLTLSLARPGSTEKAHASLSFEISGQTPSASPWDVDEPEIDVDLAKGVLDEQRALCFLAQSDPTQARLWFRSALAKDHENDVARAHLVEEYYSLSAFSSVVSLYNDVGVTDHTDAITIAEIAESFLKAGNPAKAASLLQDAIRSAPTNGALYLALADCYQHLGKTQEALESTQKGKSLLTSAR